MIIVINKSTKSNRNIRTMNHFEIKSWPLTKSDTRPDFHETKYVPSKILSKGISQFVGKEMWLSLLF